MNQQNAARNLAIMCFLAESFHESVVLHRDHYSDLKQAETVEAV